MGILEFFSYGPHIRKMLSDYTIGGLIFTLFYIFGTCILPNIYMIYFEQYKKMNNLALLIWCLIQLLWQIMVMYSIYTHLNYELENKNKEDIHNYTYDLFVKGGFRNFQKWMSYYAEDVWGDIIMLSFIFVLPIGIFDSMKGQDKIQFIFTKIGLFFVFLFFILGPPVYHISNTEVTLNSYMNNVLKFDGDPEKEGYLRYLYNNKAKIIQVLLSFALVIYIFVSGKKLKFKIKEKRAEKKLRKLKK